MNAAGLPRTDLGARPEELSTPLFCRLKREEHASFLNEAGENVPWHKVCCEKYWGDGADPRHSTDVVPDVGDTVDSTA